MSATPGEMTRAERWAARNAAQRTIASYSLALLVVAVPAIILAVEYPSKFLLSLWFLVPFALFVGLVEWTFVGFRSLLKRREIEIEGLRASGGSA